MTPRGLKTMNKEIDAKYVVAVLSELEDHVEDIAPQTLVAYHAQIGYWAAIAQGDYEKAYDARKYAEADAMLAAKLSDPKMTQALLEATATKAAMPLKEAETKAKTQAQKLEHLYQSLGRAIDANRHV